MWNISVSYTCLSVLIKCSLVPLGATIHKLVRISPFLHVNLQLMACRVTRSHYATMRNISVSYTCLSVLIKCSLVPPGATM